MVFKARSLWTKITESNIYYKYFISAFSLLESSLNMSKFYWNISDAFFSRKTYMSECKLIIYARFM